MRTDKTNTKKVAFEGKECLKEACLFYLTAVLVFITFENCD